MILDEFHFHRQREPLPKWERWGHPIDTLSVICVYLYAIGFECKPERLLGFIALSVFSCLLICKDEWIHAEECRGGEQFLHALLFLIHPIVFFSVFMMWAEHIAEYALLAQVLAMLAFFIYQVGQAYRWRKPKSTILSTTPSAKDG